MGELVVVSGVLMRFSAPRPVVITTTEHVVSVKADWASISGFGVALKSDVADSLGSYTTAYVRGDFSGGMLKFDALDSLKPLSELTSKNGRRIVIATTEGVISTAYVTRASNPKLGPDPEDAPKLTFTFAGDTQQFVSSD